LLSASEIKRIIEQQIHELFSGSFQKLKGSVTGEPVPMKDPDNVQQYWFTPFLIRNKIAGFSIQNLEGKIIINGLVSPNISDEKKGADREFLKKPPESIIKEIVKHYPGFEIISQSFSFDRVPQKWAWQIKIADEAGQQIVLFASLNGWYEKVKNGNSEREG
jgi:hypothetical protein